MTGEEGDVTIDVAALLLSAGGDHGLLDELSATFEAERPEWIASLRAALAAGDAAAVRRVAHSMAGAVGYLRAAGVRQRAVALETMGRDGRLDGAAAAIDRLEADLGALGRLLAGAPWRPCAHRQAPPPPRPRRATDGTKVLGPLASSLPECAAGRAGSGIRCQR